MTGGSQVPDKYDALVAAGILTIVLVIGVADIMLYAFWGQSYTISAYIRRVCLTYPSILAVISFAIGALFAHILFVR